MKIVQCDRCGKYVRPSDDELVQTLYLTKGSSYSDKIGDVDLCEKCMDEVLSFCFKKLPEIADE